MFQRMVLPKDIIAELDRRLHTEEVLEREDFASLIIRSTMDGIYTYDRDLKITLWNDAMERITGISKYDVLGQNLFKRFPFLERLNLQEYVLEPLKGRVMGPTVIPYDIPESGKRGFVQRQACPLYDERRHLVGGLCVMREVTDHRLAVEEVQRLNRAEERLRFLSEAGMLLTGTLDYDRVLSEVIALTTRHFDAWAKLRLLEPDGSIRLVTGHADPEQQKRFEQIEKDYPPTEDLKEGPLWILRNGGRQYIPVFTEQLIRAYAKDERHFELLRDFKTYICVPLKSHERIFGTLSVLSTERHYTEEDLSIAEDLSRWVALALENAKHFERARSGAYLARDIRRPNASSEIWLDQDGLVRVAIQPGVQQTLELAKQNFQCSVEVREGSRRPILIDLRKGEPLTQEVRQFYSGGKVGAAFTAVAILIEQTNVGTMMGNLFLRFARPGVDIRVFDRERRAIDWLKTYI